VTTFPRAIPDVAWTEIDLRLGRSVSQSRSGSRLTNVVEFADPVWVVTLQTKPLRRTEFMSVEAWWRSLREGLRTVRFRHPCWPGPKAHFRNLGPAQTIGEVASILSANTISATGLDAGLIIGAGDYVLFYNGVYHLAQITDTAGSGTTRTIEFEPAFPPGSAFAGAQVRFDITELLMRPVAGSFQKSGSLSLRQVSFDLMETRT
jgi:hypothetical protein